MKSKPELWEMLERPDLLREWSASLLGGEAEVEVTQVEQETLIGWTAALDDEAAEIEVALEESGWGTKVSLSARGDAPENFEDWAEEMLEGLSSPIKRPFSRQANRIE